ncbi:hypothetical protein HBI56_123670 [Parastagonospora nodorum]|uniref:Uncharacterized protein n=1 Tax=Phaeosphaeria nodorum (strain SN15 / ATCC MYA-4574 / FGSC 10173) TaxID=321614 RepID=A0A7U2F6B8_PHANO|nr:hypothetical protein HBH56_164950 [Parastagonospora nodorum]QRC98448.1 hypothetical protein JI435_412050 [Parastagonospora nodorum SN15]KAH3936635.1 hypothetical protein HBH54_028040 [Parastagonospora nodorum]KAH4017232.1 hypothetical protein HBI09_198530 [Parastagonospora nodorum]KAH4057091.1 hypothetical protein HBH49_041550 [Parastagonospora nodorum]
MSTRHPKPHAAARASSPFTAGSPLYCISAAQRPTLIATVNLEYHRQCARNRFSVQPHIQLSCKLQVNLGSESPARKKASRRLISGPCASHSASRKLRPRDEAFALLLLLLFFPPLQPFSAYPIQSPPFH